MVAERVRGGLPPLIAGDFDVAVDEHVLPGHEHVVEHHVAVGFVEAARQRIVERVVGAERERPARIELEARRVDRHREAVGVVLVARLQRMDAAQMQPVGQHAAGGKLLRARDHDAVVALLDHAGVERRIALLVRRLAAVDLRRHDRVADVEMLVAHAARRTRRRCRRISVRPWRTPPAPRHSRRRSPRHGPACGPSGRRSPPPIFPRTAAAGADRHGSSGSGRRAAPAPPVLGEVNVISSRFSGAAAMS